jgi:putative SOS response-associated peptidase YedK
LGETFTVITTVANELVRPIHERMPLILAPADYDAWLSPGEPSAELRIAPKADELEAVPISTWVNSTAHDDPRCMERDRTAARNFALLRKIALNLVARDRSGRTSLRGRRKKAA